MYQAGPLPKGTVSHLKNSYVCLPRLPFPSVANKLFLFLAKNPSAFTVCLSRPWPLTLHKTPAALPYDNRRSQNLNRGSWK